MLMQFGLDPNEPYHGPADALPPLASIASQPYRSDDLRPCTDWIVAEALLQVASKLPDRIPEAFRAIPEGRWIAQAQGAAHGPPDMMDLFRIKVDGVVNRPDRETAGRLRAYHRAPFGKEQQLDRAEAPYIRMVTDQALTEAGRVNLGIVAAALERGSPVVLFYAMDDV